LYNSYVYAQEEEVKELVEIPVIIKIDYYNRYPIEYRIVENSKEIKLTIVRSGPAERKALEWSVSYAVGRNVGYIYVKSIKKNIKALFHDDELNQKLGIDGIYAEIFVAQSGRSKNESKKVWLPMKGPHYDRLMEVMKDVERSAGILPLRSTLN